MEGNLLVLEDLVSILVIEGSEEPDDDVEDEDDLSDLLNSLPPLSGAKGRLKGKLKGQDQTGEDSHKDNEDVPPELL